MKVFKILIIILLLIFPSSLLWAGELNLGWVQVSKNPLLWLDNPQITNIDNKIYMISGRYDYNAKTCVSNHQCYDLGTNTWSDKANMNVSRYGTKTAAVNGKIYAFGGNDSSKDISNIVEEYDPVADTWTVKSPLPVQRLKPAVIAFNNKIYAIGGYSTDFSKSDINAVEEYDPATDTWTTKAPLSEMARDYITCLVYDNKIYVFSITREYGSSQVILQIYDPLTDTWENKEAVSVDIGYVSNYNPLLATSLDNKIYLCTQSVLVYACTQSGITSDSPYRQKTYRYDPANNIYQYISTCNAFYSSTNFVTLNNVPYACDYYGYNLYKAVLGHPPVLAYTGETGYKQDAIEPDEIKLNTTYTFKVRYFDEDNEPPSNGGPRVILQDNAHFSYLYSTYTMQDSDPSDNNYVDGKDYYYEFKSTTETGWPRSYNITMTDPVGLYTSLNNSMTELAIADSEYPSLSPIEISPKVGGQMNTVFTFRLKYTDPNNIPPIEDLRINFVNSNNNNNNNDYYYYPSPGYLLLSAEDPLDTDYRDGKYYQGTTSFSKTGDLRADIRVWNQLYLSTAEVISDTFTVTDQPLSDLIITDFCSPKEKISAGLPFDNYFLINNQGTAVAEVETEYYLSPTKSLTGAYKLKIIAAPVDNIIPISNDVKLTYSVLVPASIPPGSYYLGILCKANNDLNGDYLYWDNQQTEVIARALSDSPGTAYCFPSPAYLSKGDKIHFALLPADSEISIMLPSGDVIKRFRADSNGYVPPWDGVTDQDGLVGSGVYLVHIDSPLCDNKKLFKILVFR